MKTLAYLRISTDQQDLDSQRLEIETYAKRQNLEITEWIEVEISSRKNGHDRRIDELLSKLKRGDCLIVSEISRLARSIRQISQIMHDLSKKKVECHFIKQNLVTKGSGDMATKIYVNAFALASEIERDLIRQRTIAGLKAAKARGVVLGNPDLVKINKNRRKAADKFAETLRGVVSAFVNQGLTHRQIVDELNNVNIAARRGGLWSLMTVQRLIKRLGLVTQHTK